MRVFTICASLIFLAAGASAQSIQGVVTNQDGAPLTQGTVTITSPGGFNKRVQLDPKGAWDSGALPAGAYALSFEADGYKTVAQSGVAVAAAPVRQDAKLVAAAASSLGIQGVVRDQDGASLTQGTVTVTSSDGSNKRVFPIDPKGNYASGALTAGTYGLSFESDGYKAVTQNGVTVAAAAVHQDAKLSSSSGEIKGEDTHWSASWWGSFTLLFYFISILLTRWFKIAKPTRNFLRGQVEALESRLVLEVDEKYKLQGDKLKERLEAVKTGYLVVDLLQFFFWSQSLENAAWVAVHEVERQLTAYLSPDELVHTHLILNGARLKCISAKCGYKELTTEIDAELSSSKPNMEYRRRLLAEATAILYGERDDNFTTLMDWMNKAMWLIFATSLLLVVVGALAGNVLLFIAGAVGGLASRMMRTIQRQDVPLDYGASWTTLFMSPLYGAISGWFGIALIVLMASPQIGLLGKVFTLVKWDAPMKVTTLAVAFALGFSERLFNSIVNVLDEQVSKTASTTQQTQAAPAGGRPPSEYDKASKGIAELLGGGRTAQDQVAAFLTDLKEPVDPPPSVAALKAKVAAVESKTSSDPARQKDYTDSYNKTLATLKGLYASMKTKVETAVTAVETAKAVAEFVKAMGHPAADTSPEALKQQLAVIDASASSSASVQANYVDQATAAKL